MIASAGRSVAPTPSAPAAGLGALAKPATPTGPRGMPAGNMGQIMATARKMSDSQLADVLSGKSLDVPQYVAMTEAMGRKQLRTAMQGAEAQQAANQPNMKQKLLGEYQQQQAAQQMAQAPQMPPQGGGLAALPAPTMAPKTMAGGGIVAFANTEPGTDTAMPIREDLTEDERKQLEQNAYMQRVNAIAHPGEAISKWWNSRPSAEQVWETGRKARTGEIPLISGEEPTAKGRAVNAGLATSDTALADVPKVAQATLDKRNAVMPADLEDARSGAGMTALLNAQKNQGSAGAGGADQRSAERKSALMGTDTGTGITPEKRVNPFGQLSAEIPDYAKVKSQGLGEGLMLLSSAMFGTPNLNQAFAKGLPLLSSVSGATRKELRDLQKDYQAQQLSLAKANELFEQGQEDKGFKYFKQSQDHASDMQKNMALMASAMKPSDTIQTLNAIRLPNESTSDAYARLQGMKQDPKTDQALQIKHADYMKSAAGMLNPMSFDKWLVANGYGGGQQVAAAGNTGYSAVYGVDNKRIQ